MKKPGKNAHLPSTSPPEGGLAAQLPKPLYNRSTLQNLPPEEKQAMASSSKPQMKLLQDSGADESAVLPSDRTGKDPVEEEKEGGIPDQGDKDGQIPATNSAK